MKKVESQFDNNIEKILEDDSLEAVQWPIPDSYHPIIATDPNDKFIIYADQLSITDADKIKSRLLGPIKYNDNGKISKESSHPHVEHLLPKSEKCLEKIPIGSGEVNPWPNWNANKHEKLVECIGNKSLLEFKINTILGNKSLKFKKGKMCDSGIQATKSWANSDYKQVREITTWRPREVKARSIKITQNICGKWKEDE